MSMLSEPRRKQKWCLNPRGTLWSNDENKFGQKMLEKMGWSKGKGLGKNEDGKCDHVKVNYKNDSRGMGFKGADDNWIAHQDDFSDFLSQLNDEHSSTHDNKKELSQESSLEKRSKSSKKRVHYHKFTRGKDLSKYSTDDISSILGKRTLDHEKVSKCEEKPTDEDEQKLKTSGMSVDDYFSKKMKEKKTESFFSNKTDSALSDGSSDEVQFVPFKSTNSDEVNSFKTASPITKTENKPAKKKKKKMESNSKNKTDSVLSDGSSDEVLFVPFKSINSDDEINSSKTAIPITKTEDEPVKRKKKKVK